MTFRDRHFHSSTISLVALAAASALFGCGGSSAGTGSSGTVKAAATTNATSSPVDTPKDSSTKPDAPSGSTTTTAVTSPSPSPFHVVADVDYGLSLQRLGKNALLAASDQFLQISGNTVIFDAKYAPGQEIRGDGVSGAFESLVGVFPDALFATVIRPSGRTGFTELYKWTGSKWTSHYSTAETTFVLGVQSWQNGTVLMVEAHSMSAEYRFVTLPKGTKVFTPEARDSKWKGAFGYCTMGFIPEALRTSPAGDVYLTGMSCTPNSDTDDTKVAVQHWAPNSSKSTVDPLPDIGTKSFSLVNLAIQGATSAYIGGNTSPSRVTSRSQVVAYLAHYDGKAWTADSLPFSDELVGLDVEPDGKLWAVSVAGRIYSRPDKGAWAEVALPRVGRDEKSMTASDIWVRGANDVWIIGAYKAAAGEGGQVVLHSGPAVELAKLPDLETMSDKVSELAMPTPFTARCVSPFVLLFTLSKVAPPDFDYPATRAALKGHKEFEGARFIEFKRLDKRYMGAFVPDGDMGKKLVELVKKKVPNSTPQMACHAPKPSRELEIEL